ncbi:MAG: hypothetical protein H6832_06585 [Planctomycetes bacterium]|nr:hypothetical protein [Planctomycetota bacterium]MCB9918054.1 hypothetical protein [Planctomycetota bacterium]
MPEHPSPDLESLRRALQEQQDRELRHGRLFTLRASVVRQLAKETTELEALAETLASEQQDVARLEGLSLASIFYTLLSSKTERLEKERAEVARAKLRYDERFEACQTLEGERLRIERELEALGDVEGDRERLLKAKAEALTALGGDSSHELVSWIDRVARARAHTREGEEALHACRDTLRNLEDVVEAITKARDWGRIDMFGGGLGTTLIKHSRLDSAKSLANLAQRNLRRFERELGEFMDIDDLRIETPEVAKFADIFFDGLIFDWLAQRQITASLEQAQTSRNQMRRVLTRLERAVAESRRAAEEAEDGYRRFLYDA